MTSRTKAVVIDGACKAYGRSNKPDYKPVLRHLDMTVHTGTIYGLLGPSGCGKTTLLSCIVGRKQLDSGRIWVLGTRPGGSEGVLGPRVGYMPQDVALIAEFSVRDAVYYFGRISGLTNYQLQERFNFLSSLLELPKGSKLIKDLSGGQQRRVSFAAALVHEPELLILDEPTVGLDPVLRDTIWNHLAKLTSEGTTVIITTHYIDETKTADKIGLLRDGRLLAEDSPSEILRRSNCDTLEDAFLKMAMSQEKGHYEQKSVSYVSPVTFPESTPQNDESTLQNDESSPENYKQFNKGANQVPKRRNHIKREITTKSVYSALFHKSMTQFIRNPASGFIFSILFPILQLAAFFVAVGHEPRELKVAVVNEEAISSFYGANLCGNKSASSASRFEYTCEPHFLSCWFLKELENNKLQQLAYTSVAEAKSAVTNGKLYGALYIPANFSDTLETRVREGRVENDVVEASTISIWLDMSNYQISHFLQMQLHKVYRAFTKKYMKACDRPEDLIQIPVRFHDPIYGRSDSQFTYYLAPGIMMTITFFLSAVVTSTLMIGDRLEGVWERSAVAGVKARDALTVHIGVQAAIIFIQTIELMVLALTVYGLPHEGSLLLPSLLLYIQGLAGMCYGFLLSLLCTSYTMTFFVATGSFYPIILLCGIVWPIEAMAEALKPLAYCLPLSVPSKSLRSLMTKGAPITDPEVYLGFIVTIAWTLMTVGLCFLRLKYKKS